MKFSFGVPLFEIKVGFALGHEGRGAVAVRKKLKVVVDHFHLKSFCNFGIRGAVGTDVSLKDRRVDALLTTEGADDGVLVDGEGHEIAGDGVEAG